VAIALDADGLAVGQDAEGLRGGREGGRKGGREGWVG